jgi:hypothetical protein
MNKEVTHVTSKATTGPFCSHLCGTRVLEGQRCTHESCGQLLVNECLECHLDHAHDIIPHPVEVTVVEVPRIEIHNHGIRGLTCLGPHAKHKRDAAHPLSGFCVGEGEPDDNT